jgi:serine/threonine protein kinase
MPSPASATDFLDMLRKSGLVAPEQLAAAVRANPQAGIDHFAATLIRAGLLTRFQAKQVKQGKYKKFTLAGKYQLLELLGVGGMGAVYLCEHTFMHRLVAVKVLPMDKIATDKTAVDRFYREARAAAALDHPNIVHAYDIDQADGLHFLVLEFVDGRSLQEIVARYAEGKRFFDPVRAAYCIAQAAAGLAHATQMGLVHRDIKPGNLLLDRDGTVKILDMGLARFFDHRHDDLTLRFDDGCILGTADYLAPEQAMNEAVDVRTDIYGLGGTLYFLLTGSSPFPDGSIAEKLARQQKGDPTPVTAFRPDVPPKLLAVMNRMMRKNPDDRYQTPEDVLAALKPWTDQPIDLPPAAEMPEHCPAVLSRMGAGTSATRSTPSQSGQHQALVQTGRAAATTPMRKVHADRRPKKLWPLLLAVGGGGFLLALLLAWAVVFAVAK